MEKKNIVYVTRRKVILTFLFGMSRDGGGGKMRKHSLRRNVPLVDCYCLGSVFAAIIHQHKYRWALFFLGYYSSGY